MVDVLDCSLYLARQFAFFIFEFSDLKIVVVQITLGSVELLSQKRFALLRVEQLGSSFVQILKFLFLIIHLCFEILNLSLLLFQSGIVSERLCFRHSNLTLELSHLLLVLDKCFVLLNVLLL